MSEAAIKALNEEITAVEKAQEPARLQIATLTADLTAGDETIRRNRAAIALLNGDTPVSAPRLVRASRTATPAVAVSTQRIVDYIGANGASKALEIADAVGIGGPPLSKALKALVDDGILTKEGEKRGTKYSLKVG